MVLITNEGGKGKGVPTPAQGTWELATVKSWKKGEVYKKEGHKT